MLDTVKKLLIRRNAKGGEFHRLQLINAALYSAYINDRPPFSAAHSDILHKTPGLALYLGQCEDIPRTAPESWRFRLKGVQCRSHRLSRLFAIGSDISELSLSGVERLWREDLLMMMERRKPVLATLTLPLDFFEIEIEHLALPFFRKGRIVDFVGGFSADEMSLRAIRRSKKLKLASVRRALRPRTLELPKAKRLEGAGAEGRKFWRAMTNILESNPDGKSGDVRNDTKSVRQLSQKDETESSGSSRAA